MPTIRITITSILAVGLLSGWTVATLAQDEGYPPLVYFTGSVAEPARVVEPDVSAGELGWTMSGQEVYDIPFQMSDPRISGSLSFLGQGAGGGPIGEQGFVEFDSKTYRIDNDSGSWEGEGVRLKVSDQGQDQVGIETLRLTGAGAYDGLFAYVVVDFLDEPPIHGIITSLEPAAFPPPVPAPAE